MPVFARNIVSTSHPLAAQAGLRMMQQGGNAVDAAIAAAAVMTIVEPCSNGLGSDAFCILWDGTQLHGLNASGPAPAAWTPDYFRRKYGADAARPPMRGWDSVTVPGAVAGWVALSERFGTLPFADLLAPAIEIAERGYAVPIVVQQKWVAAAPLLGAQPGWAEAFLPQGRPPEVGERFAFPAAARALRAIAATRGAALYGGEIAAAAARMRARNGGGDDGARLRRRSSPSGSRRSASTPAAIALHEIPPNGQGIAALIALGILRHFDLASLPVDGAESQHLQIEAMKLAFADVYAHVADARRHALHAERRCSTTPTSPTRARADRPEAGAALRAPAIRSRGGTIYLSAADERGMMVSFIQSNYMGFGSGVRRARLGRLDAEPRPRLRPRPGEPERASRRASGRSTPSSRPSSPRTAGRR